MKKYSIYLIIIAAVSLFSCNKALDLPTDGRIGINDIFNDYDRTRGYLNSLYGNPGFYTPLPYMDRASYTDEAHDADDVSPSSNYALWYAGTVNSSTYGGASQDGQPWGRLFEGIRKCNSFLRAIRTATVVVSDEEKAGWVAQAHTLRALYYLQLIKRFGGVPIFTEPLEINRDFSKDRRASFSEVVKLIVADCDSALMAPNTQNGFSWNIYDNQFNKMHRAVPYAIKSEAVLYAASPLWSDGTYTWANATQVTAEALQQCLANDYKLFNVTPSADIAQNAYTLYFLTNPNDRRAVDKETIWGVNQCPVWQWAGLPTTSGINRTGPSPSQEMVDSYEMINGEAPILGYSDVAHLVPIINVNSAYDPNNPYVGRDPRFYGSIYYNQAPVSLDPGSAGMKFTATAAFTAINAVCPSWGNSIGNLTFTLYRWNNTYAASIAGIPLAQKVFVNFADGAALELNFPEQPAGDYLWVLSDGTETVGVWKMNDSQAPAVSYFKGAVTQGDYISSIAYAPGQFTKLYTDGGQAPVQIIGGRKVQSYVGGADEISDFNTKHTRTGYYLRKYNNWRSGPGNNADGWARMFRLAELYMNFAEAANQSVGPDEPVSANGRSMSAREAVNAVRARAGMPPFPIGMTKEAFAKKYRNERRIEFAFEDHRFFDLRRWKILNENGKFVTAMRITPSTSGYTYQRIKLMDRNSWQDKWLMYPVPQEEVTKVMGLSGQNWQNPGWD